MTRADVVKLFPDATDEQVTQLLNSYNTDIAKEKTKVKELTSTSKDSEDKIKELEAQLEEIENAKLSDIEKVNKANEVANTKIADLEKQIVAMEQKTKLAEMGIVGDDAETLIGADGKLNFEKLSSIISDREKKAMAQKEQELLKKTPNPEGNPDGSGADTKPADVVTAENITFGNEAPSDEIKNYYKI